MIISLWRSGLKQWLTAKMLVATWDLRNPIIYNSINGFIPPLQSINYQNNQENGAVAIQDFYLTSRHPATTKYADLPIGDLEQTYSTISRRLSLEYSSLAPLIELDMVPVADPIQVIEYGEGMADWLITMVFSCRIRWVVSPFPLPGDSLIPTTPITSINAGLFTEKLSAKDHLAPATRDKFATLIVRPR